MTKDLKEKAIDIKGKNYVLVSDRVIYFNDTYKNGAIKTKLVSDTVSDTYIIRATIIPDVTVPERFFTGYSQAKIGDGLVNKTAALENAETSAVGRGLAMMGIGVIDSIASLDEVNKATRVIHQTDEERMEFKDTKCQKCGAPMNISKSTGKPYCSALCWKNPAPKKEIQKDILPHESGSDLPF